MHSQQRTWDCPRVADGRAWREYFRRGLAPLLCTEALAALAAALAGDDCRVLQGMTIMPPAGEIFGQETPDAGCALAYALWRTPGNEHITVIELEQLWVRLLLDADVRLGRAGASRDFLRWYDGAERPAMRILLAAEIERELLGRHAHKEPVHERDTQLAS